MKKCLSIAGFDPSAGAGVLSDCKTFENLGVYGFGVSTATTIQNEDTFRAVHWQPFSFLTESLDVLFQNHVITHCKIGLIENKKVLGEVVKKLYAHNSTIKIIWDPVLKPSSGGDFENFNPDIDTKFLDTFFLITPNRTEAKFLELEEKDNVLITGSGKTKTGEDVLFKNGKKIVFFPYKKPSFEKHGSGCVFSSAICAYLAHNFSLEEAIKKAKKYTENFLASSETLLGTHK